MLGLYDDHLYVLPHDALDAIAVRLPIELEDVPDRRRVEVLPAQLFEGFYDFSTRECSPVGLE